jgi:hypothetical protein
MPSLARLSARFKGEPVRVIAISQDRLGGAVVKPFLQQNKIPRIEVLLDQEGQSGRQLANSMLPTTILLDPSGNEIARLVGATEWDSSEIVALITALMRARS